MVNRLFVAYLIIAIILRLYLWSEIRYIFGTDVGRFAEISHIWYLKGEITPDLRPYNMAYGFFYFLLPILMPTALEYLGIDPITSMTAFVFIFSILSCVAFYFIMRQFFDDKKSAHIFFFYSILFDITLAFGIAGIYPFALCILWFFLAIYFLNRMFFGGKKSWVGLGMSVMLMSLTHIYLFIPSLCYMFALISYEIIKENSLKRTKFSFKETGKSMVFPIIANIPVFMVFGKYFDISFNYMNTGLQMVASPFKWFSITDKIYVVFMSSPLTATIIYMTGFVFFIIALVKFKGKEIVWVFYAMYMLVISLFTLGNANMARMVSALWVVFAIGFGNLLVVPLFNVATLPLFYYFPSSSVIYYVNVLEQDNQTNHNAYPWVIWNDFYEAIDFIKKNVPGDSVFLMDSGGSGCFGSSSSYGDRIFPLTSRKPFYFTDYCWAVWDFEDYEKRIGIYNKISINPNDKDALGRLVSYNVTHVFVGPNDIGLNYRLFKESEYYEEIYNENEFSIFKIK